MNLSIKNEVLFNKNLGDKAIAIMLLMSGLRSDFNKTVISVDQISYYLYGKMKFNQKNTDTVKQSIKELISEKVLTPIECEKNRYEFYTSDLSVGTDGNFTLISIDEFEKLKDNLKLLRFFLVVVSTINNKDKVGFNTYEQLAEKSHIDISTVGVYNKILQERELLFIYNEYQFVNGQQSANTYGRIIDKELVIQNAKQFYRDRNTSADRTMTGNERRRISKQYNDYCKGSFKGDVEKLKEDCKRYNDLTQQGKSKDLSVFDKESKKKGFLLDWMDRGEIEMLFGGTTSSCDDYYLC